MATAERDYYELLGVERTATEAEIKKAFRKLARELHPDVSQEPDAQARFRAVAEAYEVLSKAETRQLYDRYGHAGLKRGGYSPSDFDFSNLTDIFSAFFGDDLFARNRGGRARGGDVGVPVGIELADAFTGVTRTVEVEVAATCERCDGEGAEPGTERVTCATCGGQGQLQQVSRSVFGEFVRTQTCPTCGGAGRVAESPVHRLRGRRPHARDERARGRDPGGDSRRPADPSPRGRARGLERRPPRRCVRGGARRPRPALRARRRRHPVADRPDDRPGCARRDALRAHARRRARAGLRGGHAAGRSARAARQGDAVARALSAAAITACSSTSPSRDT